MITIEGLKKRLGSKQVLDGVDLEIEKGETIVIMGRSVTGLIQNCESSLHLLNGCCALCFGGSWSRWVHWRATPKGRFQRPIVTLGWNAEQVSKVGRSGRG